LFICSRNKEEITDEILSPVRVFIIAGSKEKFTENEFNCMKKYMENGGSILVVLGEGGETAFPTNINFLLEEYGIMVNNGKLNSKLFKYLC
jgi:intraflagellar transport protein 52